MRKEPGETFEQIMELTVKAIEKVENVPLRVDLYATTSILAEKRYTAALIVYCGLIEPAVWCFRATMCIK